ncbi:MAG TPA: TasA family protein [Thermoleophilaceae bacterium]
MNLKRTRKMLRTGLALGLTAALAGGASWSAFSSTATNGGNSFAAGTVSLSDNDAGQALLSLSGAKPGDSQASCLKATYAGTLPASVRLYASATGGLAPYLNLVVTRGTDPAASFPSCGGFTADTTNYIGQGAGVVYSGTLAAFPSSYGAASDEPLASSPESWTQGESHSYRFTVTLANNAAAQGLTGSATFTWEARNE